MKHTLMICLLLLVSPPAKAQDQPPILLDHPQSLRHTDFLKLTVGNDSLVALTNLFFRKRGTAKTLYWVSGGTIVLFPLVAGVTAIASENDPSSGLQAASVVVSIGFISAVTASTVNMVKYNRRDLAAIIRDYPTTGAIPEKFKKKLKPKDFPNQR